jgi:XTP/dITP diphosphohydrolase
VQRLLVATTNAGKLRDFSVAAGSLVEIEPMPGLKSIAAPDEDEDSFEGNARIKAIYYSRFAPEEVVIADDSGIEVDALGGAPGVRSARYAEDCGFMLDASTLLSQDERNNECLMAAMRDVPADARGGRYRCVLAAARDGVVLATGVGAVEGRILEAARGNGGFGYDPYFVPEGETLSMAELDAERRMKLSHRGRALNDLMTKLSGAGMMREANADSLQK